MSDELEEQRRTEAVRRAVPEEVRRVIRRLRQANIAGILRESENRNASEAEKAWHELAEFADLPPRRLLAVAVCEVCGAEGSVVVDSFGMADIQPLEGWELYPRRRCPEHVA